MQTIKEIYNLKTKMQKDLTSESEPDVMAVVGYIEKIIELCDELAECYKKIDDLEDSELQLIALEGAGVDNWEGFDFAMESYMEMKKNGN